MTPEETTELLGAIKSLAEGVKKTNERLDRLENQRPVGRSTLVGPDNQPLVIKEKRLSEEQARALQSAEESAALDEAVEDLDISDPRLRERFGLVGGGGRIA